MVVLTALISAISRQAGRVATTLFGWAVMMLFGKVPENKQMWLSAVALGSIVWVALLLGVAFPSVGLFLLGFVPRLDFVSEDTIRIGMLVGAAILPAVIGAISGLVLTDDKKGGKGLLVSILRGYPYALALAITLAILFVYVPVLKLAAIVKRWEDVHLPAMVKPEAYDQVVTDIHKALENVGLTLNRDQAPFMLRLPPKVLATLGGVPIAGMVAERLTQLKGDDEQLELTLYPSDLLLRGKKEQVVVARSVVVRQMAFSDAYMTWTKEANELEDRLRKIWREARTPGSLSAAASTVALQHLNDVQDDIDRSTVDHEEWEVLYREKMEFERQILQAVSGSQGEPKEPRESTAAALGMNRAARPSLTARDLVAAAASLPAVGTLGLAGVLLWYLFRGR